MLHGLDEGRTKGSRGRTVAGDSRFEKIDERIIHGVVAMDEEELRGGTVEAVERRLHWVDEVTAGTQDVPRSADVQRRGWE